MSSGTHVGHWKKIGWGNWKKQNKNNPTIYYNKKEENEPRDKVKYFQGMVRSWCGQ